MDPVERYGPLRRRPFHELPAIRSIQRGVESVRHWLLSNWQPRNQQDAWYAIFAGFHRLMMFMRNRGCARNLLVIHERLIGLFDMMLIVDTHMRRLNRRQHRQFGHR